MLAKISTKEVKGNYHRDSVIRDLKAEIEQLQHQVKLIQSQNKENEKPSFQKKEKTKKANLVKVSERSWLSMKQIKNCIDTLEEQLNIEPTVHIIVPYVNSLLTAFEYQFERISGMLDDRDERIIQQEKINFQIRQQYLQIQKKLNQSRINQKNFMNSFMGNNYSQSSILASQKDINSNFIPQKRNYQNPTRQLMNQTDKFKVEKRSSISTKQYNFNQMRKLMKQEENTKKLKNKKSITKAIFKI